MKKSLLFAALLVLLTPLAFAQEAVTLTVPIVKTATSACSLDSLLLDIPRGRIVASLTCNNGDTVIKQYDQFSAPTGASLLTTLNRSNNSVGNPSLIAKVYNRLIADGVIAGTVGGTPQ